MEIIFYENRNGEKPAEEFINSLDKKLRVKVERVIQALAQDGSMLGMPFSKYLDDGIYELRASLASNTARVLYFFIVGNCAVLTHGFIKKTQDRKSVV